MLNTHYTQSFQDFLDEYEESPEDSKNPSPFCLNIVRLRIKKLLRTIHCDKGQKHDCTFSSFFRIIIVEFIKSYHTSFELSPESCFTCHHLGVDGIVTTVWETAIAAKDIGKHVDTQHTYLHRFASLCRFNLFLWQTKQMWLHWRSESLRWITSTAYVTWKWCTRSTEPPHHYPSHTPAISLTEACVVRKIHSGLFSVCHVKMIFWLCIFLCLSDTQFYSI